MKKLIFLGFIVFVFLIACTQTTPTPTKCVYSDSSKYITQGPGCVINFMCMKGTEAFSDECGCGCKPVETNQCDYSSDARRYIEKDKEKCPMIEFRCNQSETPFSDDCGCGCRAVEGNQCNYVAPDKDYKAKSADECARIRFTCENGKEYFNDECGCGCHIVNEERHTCSETERNSQMCMALYKPVCGYVQVECIRAPCYPVRQTFSNSCAACQNKRVLYWIDGECPT